MGVLFERLVWQDILTGKTAMHILIGHCAQTNCSDKTYVLFVRIFRSDTLKGHADRREVGTFWKSNERGYHVRTRCPCSLDAQRVPGQYACPTCKDRMAALRGQSYL